MNYIDLFAGAGGLSEGFYRTGFNPIAHVEMDADACYTLKTRAAYYYLRSKQKEELYLAYISGKISRAEFYAKIPEEILNSVIHESIGKETILGIFDKIDVLRGNQEVDVIIGGPPCQAYSLAGRARDPKGMKEDSRNYLFQYYAQFLKKYQPKYFVFENVQGLLSANNGQYFQEMRKLFQSEEVGYNVDFKILNASNYGVLQDRKRVILIGQRGKQNFEFPRPHKINNTWQVLRDLFSDLPILAPGEGKLAMSYNKNPIPEYLLEFGLRTEEPFVIQHITRPHNPRDLQIYKKAIEAWVLRGERLKYNELPEELITHKNTKHFLDRFKVVNHLGICHTVVAHISKDGHYYIYPSLEQVRSISVREAARLQSFPDNFFFEGSRTAMFRQIGNAVPPLMGEAIGREIKKSIQLCCQKLLKSIT